jgi:hypothetical protein
MNDIWQIKRVQAITQTTNQAYPHHPFSVQYSSAPLHFTVTDAHITHLSTVWSPPTDWMKHEEQETAEKYIAYHTPTAQIKIKEQN